MLPSPRTLRERVAQCVMIRLGSNMSPQTTAGEDLDRVVSLLRDCPVGGLLLFNARWPDVTSVLGATQEASRVPLLVASDIERGVGQQVREATLFPHAMAVGHGVTPEMRAAQLARMTAREARACGIHWAFAPVADVNLEPDNPIINVRAFGDTPDRVAACVEAYVRAARDEGLLTTAKHFPGHGRTRTDSHAERPIVDTSRDELEATDLVPFRAAMEAGVDSVMTAHVAYPNLDAEAASTRRMATASPPILGDLLRETYGFGGLVVSDSLLMEGARDDRTEGEQAVRLFQAGVDVLLDPDDPEALVETVVQAVKDGRLAVDRIQDACTRVQQAKARVHDAWGDTAFHPGVGPAAGTEVGRLSHRDAAASMAGEGVDVVRGADRLPLDAGEGTTTVIVGLTPRPVPETDTQSPLHPFSQALQSFLPEATVVESHGPSGDELGAVRNRIRGADHAVLAALVEPAAWQHFGLQPRHASFVRDVLADRKEAGRPTVGVALGSPYTFARLDDVPDGGPEIEVRSYSTVPVSLTAAAERLVQTT